MPASLVRWWSRPRHGGIHPFPRPPPGPESAHGGEHDAGGRTDRRAAAGGVLGGVGGMVDHGRVPDRDDRHLHRREDRSDRPLHLHRGPGRPDGLRDRRNAHRLAGAREPDRLAVVLGCIRLRPFGPGRRVRPVRPGRGRPAAPRRDPLCLAEQGGCPGRAPAAAAPVPPVPGRPGPIQAVAAGSLGASRGHRCQRRGVRGG